MDPTLSLSLSLPLSWSSLMRLLSGDCYVTKTGKFCVGAQVEDNGNQ